MWERVDWVIRKYCLLLLMLYRWDFGDGSGKVIQSKDAPCQSMGQPVEKEKKQMYVQDSVNFTYLIPGNQMNTHTHANVCMYNVHMDFLESSICHLLAPSH